MDLDQILSDIGEFGKYQKLILWFVLLPAVFPCGFHAYNQLFMAGVPKYWCKGLNNSDERLGMNKEFSQCYTTEDILNKTEIVPCRNGWIYESSIYKRTVVTEWDLVCDKDFLPTLTLVLLGLGGLIGNFIFGYLQDGLGRKNSFFIYLFIQCLFGTATALAQNFTTWTIFRVGVGFTVPAILATPYVLAVELVGARHRTVVTILVNISYSLALIALSILVWYIRDWRTLALATALPFFGYFLFWWFLPESPRWLLAQGRFREAEEILKQIAKINGKPFNHLHIPNKTLQASKQKRTYGMWDLFKESNLRTKTLIITFIWFTNTSVYVGLSYYAPSLGGDEFLNFFLAGIVELPTYLFLWPAMEIWGRRWTLCVSMIIGGTACLATFLVRNDSLITLILYCIGKMGISSSFVVLPLMASELYPTVVRGLGMSISSVIGMLGPVFIPLVNYLGTDMLTLPLIIMGAMLMIGGVFSLFLPETLRQHLPQTLEDGEKTKANFSFCCIQPNHTPLKLEIIETSH